MQELITISSGIMNAPLTVPEPSRQRYETPPDPAAAQVRRFTVPEYHEMIRGGVLGEDEPFELLEGWIVRTMPNDPVHAATVSIVAQLLRDRLPSGYCVREQAPVTSHDSEPEPDVAVVRGSLADYLDHHPSLEETVLVIEAANTSLSRDRDWKQRIYARAGTPEYWIIDLDARRIERMTEPSGPTDEPATFPAYRRREVCSPEGSMQLPIEGAPPLRVADVFPPGR